MKINHFTSNNCEKVFFIEFGDKYYEVFEYEIAYVSRSNGITFIANTNAEKFPISVKSLNKFFSNFNSKQFFKISNETIVNRDAIFYLEEYNDYLFLTFNFKKTIALKISSTKIDKFKKWFHNKLQ
jgi:DNA-binding LytR/AlgR family response regulator